jgi:hypothetical protein
VVWAKPPGSAPTKGVLLAFHGCSHAATDWFPHSESCKDCIGAAGGAVCSTSVQRLPQLHYSLKQRTDIPTYSVLDTSV